MEFLLKQVWLSKGKSVLLMVVRESRYTIRHSVIVYTAVSLNRDSRTKKELTMRKVKKGSEEIDKEQNAKGEKYR